MPGFSGKPVLFHHPGQSQRRDTGGPRLFQDGGTLIQGDTGGEDVVHQQNLLPNNLFPPGNFESPSHIVPSFPAGKSGLHEGGPSSFEAGLPEGQAGLPAKMPGQFGRLVKSPFRLPFLVKGDGDHTLYIKRDNPASVQINQPAGKRESQASPVVVLKLVNDLLEGIFE